MSEMIAMGKEGWDYQGRVEWARKCGNSIARKGGKGSIKQGSRWKKGNRKGEREGRWKGKGKKKQQE